MLIQAAPLPPTAVVLFSSPLLLTPLHCRRFLSKRFAGGVRYHRQGCRQR